MRTRPRLSRRSLRTSTFGAGAAVAVSLAAVMAGTPASAAAPAVPTDPAAAARVLASAESALGDKTAGTYLDAQGRPVVTVTDSASAQKAAATGAVPKLVKHSRAVLDAAASTLSARATIPGTSWSVDPAANQVVIEYDQTVTGASLQRLQQVAASLGDAVRMTPLSGVISTRISGGDAIYGGGYRCSLGFNVHIGTANYFLTAGHCGNVASTWYSNSGQTTVLGTTSRSTFPGSDYALVKYTSTSVTVSGSVGSQDITTAGTPTVGQTVTRRGSTTGIHSGTVTALNATVNYAEGSVRGLIRTTVCAEPGDSGGSLYAGTTALGLTSGGSGNCTSGGVTYFQPVVAALNAYGASVF